jgi:hypothetical protein
MDAKSCEKDAKKYCCEICDYYTSRKSSHSKHLLSSKHINRTNLNDLEQTSCETNKYCCKKCNKSYKVRNSLWYHEQKCKESAQSNIEEKPDMVDLLINENKDFKNVIIELLKNNSDLHQQVLDVCQKIQPNNTINNTNNSYNKTFNLQFFLNEQCKDAMNIMDFVNTFQLQFSDLERIGEVGYVEGISAIIIDKLNKMDIYKRPIHCSDAKREIMHVKDNDVWSKDNANNDKIRLALKHITKKNIDLIRPWAIAHPGAMNSDHKLNDKYQEMVIEAMGGNKNKTMKEGEDKIIKKISKMVLIDKYN